MFSLRSCLAGLALAVLSLAPGAQAPCGSGVWRLTSTSYRPNGTELSNPATSTVSCLFGGRVEMAEYRDLAPDGTVRFRGVGFHAWDAQRTERTTLWLMLGDPGHTLIVERMEGGVLVSEGSGADAGGSFLERSRTTFDEEGGYRFEMERSFDDGETWRLFNVIDAVRESEEAPSAPQRALALVEAQAAVGVEPAGVVVLDGLAQVEARTEEVDGRTLRTLRFSARYARPDRWRTVVWEVGSLEIEREERAIE